MVLSGLVSGFSKVPCGVGDPWLFGFVFSGGDVSCNGSCEVVL